RLAVLPGQRAGVVLGVGSIDRRTLKQRALRRGQHRPTIELADVILIILENAAKLDLVSIGRAHRELHQAGRDLVPGIADLGAVAVLVISLRAVDRAAEYIDIGIGAHAAKDRAHAARTVGAAGAGHVDAPALARAHDIVDVLGAERDHAADRAGAVDVRGRAPHHVDAADQFGIEEERAVGVVPAALVVLPRTVDHDRDAAEILQAADVDDGRGIVAALLDRHAGYLVEDAGQPVRLQALDLLQRHHADGSQRVDRALLGLRGRHRNRIERLHRRAASLRPSIYRRRSSLRILLRFCLLALGLLLFLLLGSARDGLRFERLRERCA